MDKKVVLLAAGAGALYFLTRGQDAPTEAPAGLSGPMSGLGLEPYSRFEAPTEATPGAPTVAPPTGLNVVTITPTGINAPAPFTVTTPKTPVGVTPSQYYPPAGQTYNFEGTRDRFETSASGRTTFISQPGPPQQPRGGGWGAGVGRTDYHPAPNNALPGQAGKLQGFLGKMQAYFTGK